MTEFKLNAFTGLLDIVNAGTTTFNIQSVGTKTSAYITISTVMPINSIPTNVDGDEVLTATITPISATSNLLIIFNTFSTTDTLNVVGGGALFRDSIVNAIAAASICQNVNSIDVMQNSTLVFLDTSNNTNPTTYKARCGAAGGNMYINGNSGSLKFGAVALTSLTIIELPS